MNISTTQSSKYYYWIFCCFLFALCASGKASAQVTITTQPAAQTVCVGQTATFSVVATGTIAGYQWFKNGVPIMGANSSTYTTPVTTAADHNAKYSVEVECSCGSDQLSNDANLTVNLKPTITTHPVGATKCVGETFTATVVASNAGSYQWYKDGAPLADGAAGGGSVISGATTATLLVSNLCATCNPGSYTVQVLGGGACNTQSVTSNAAVLVVNEPADITVGSALSQAKCEGESLTLSVTAVGTAPITYQWKKDATNVGPNSNTFGIANLTTTDAGGYSVTASNSCGSDTHGTINLTVNAKPTITIHPVGATKCVGETFTATVVASNAGSYQWYKDGAPLADGTAGGGSVISGATTATLLISNLCATCNPGSYTVQVLGGGACNTQSVTSNAAVLVVNEPADITVGSALSQAKCEGESLTLSVTAVGTITGFQWKKGATNLTGQVGTSLTLTNLTAADAGAYSVEAFAACGNESYGPINLTINQKPTITTHPVGATKCVGENYMFSVVATNAGTYQWQKNGTNIPSANSAGYFIPTLSTSDAGLYSIVVNGAGACASETVRSTNAVLVMNVPITISTQPQSQALCDGASLNLSISAAGTITGYQWFRNGNTLTGATNNSFGFLTTLANNNDKYKVEVLGACGNVTSTEVTLTVNAKPAITTQPVNITKCAGENHNFSIVAVNVGTYQWRKNGTNITGANGSGYLIPTLSSNDAGLYSVVVNGAGACASEVVTSANAVLNINVPVTISTQPQSQSICDGAGVNLSVVAAGTITGYQWFKNGSTITGATNNGFGFLTTLANNNDKYKVEVLGACGNVTSTEATLTIVSPNVPSITTNKPNGMCEAEQSILTATGCKTTDNVQWYSDGASVASGLTFTTNSTATFTAKCQEGVCLTVQNSNAIKPVQLTPVNYTATKQNITCFEGKDGKIEITPSGAAGAPYTIAWQNPQSQSFQVADLISATYTFTLTDKIGCKKTFNETLTQPSKPSGTITSEDITCFGAANGKMILNAKSDYAGFQFILNGNPAVAFSGGSTHSFTTLNKGTYSVRVIDAKNCEVIPVTNITIKEPTALELKTTTARNPRGATTKDGSIEVAMSGGTEPYNIINWTTAQGIFVPSNSNANTTKIGPVEGGSYRLRVVDKNGCEKILSAVIVTPAPIAVVGKVDSVSCFGRKDGKIEAAITGGVKVSSALPYNTVWKRLNANGSSEEIAKNTVSVGDLPPGEYEIAISDSNAITFAQKFVLVEPTVLKSNVVSTVPNYCLSTPLGEAVISIEGGRRPYAVKWDKTAETGLTVNKLAAGSHIATITDKSGCVTTATATVADNTNSYRLAVAYKEPTCFGRCDGRLDGTVQGGTTPYQYSWTNLTEKTAIITNACGTGSTVLEVRDAKGCVIRSSSVALTTPAPRALGLAKEKEVCPSKPFELSASTVTWGKTFTWTLPNKTTKTGPIIQGDTIGVYKLTVLDENSCGGQDEIAVVANKNVQQLFTVASEAAINRPVVCIDLTNPIPSAIRWEYLGATLVSQETYQVKITYPKTGKYQIKELATVNDCVYTLIKQIEIKEKIDDKGFPAPIGFNPLDVKVLGNPVNDGRIGLEILNEANENFTIMLHNLSGTQTLYQKEFVNHRASEVQMELPSHLLEGTYMLTVRTATAQFSTRIFITR